MRPNGKQLIYAPIANAKRKNIGYKLQPIEIGSEWKNNKKGRTVATRFNSPY
jgi:hypothetical protein